MSHPDPWQGQPRRAPRSIRPPRAPPQQSGRPDQGPQRIITGQRPSRPAQAPRRQNNRLPRGPKIGTGRGRPAKAGKTGQGPAEKEVSADPHQEHLRHFILALDSGVKEDVAEALYALNSETHETAESTSPFLASAELLRALRDLIQAGRENPARSLEVAKQLLRGDQQSQSYSERGPPRPEYESTTSATVLQSGHSQNLGQKARSNEDPKEDSAYWWIEESEVFNLDEANRLFEINAAASASNVIRNLACIQINVWMMAGDKRLVHTLIEYVQHRDIEDEELVTNCLDALVLLAHSNALRPHIFDEGEMKPDKAMGTIVDVLESPVEEWQKLAAYLLECFAMDPDVDYDPYLLPFVPRVYRCLIGLAGVPKPEVQEAAVSALASISDLEDLQSCNLRLLEQPWAVKRLLSIIEEPHPKATVVAKAANTLLRRVTGSPEGIAAMQGYESICANIAFSPPHAASDTFAHILLELTPKEAPDGSSVWGAGADDAASETPDDASLRGTGEANSEITQAPGSVRATASSSSEDEGYPDDVWATAAEGGEGTASSGIACRSGSSTPSKSLMGQDKCIE